MKLGQLREILKDIPEDATLKSNSGWECNETDMDGVWYSKTLNEVHFTQDAYSDSHYEITTNRGTKVRDFILLYGRKE